MSNEYPSDDRAKSINGKPDQLLPFSEKTQDWYERMAEFYIRNTWSMSVSKTHGDALFRELYEVYNSKFPLTWFSHITNPLNSKKEQHKRFPAKIRPINILRTSIDLLINELEQRPFVYQVINTGEKAYNEFQERLTQSVVQNLQQHFVAQLQQMQMPGVEPQEEQEIPLPEKIAERHHASYMDNQAIRGQRWLSRTLDDVRFNQKKKLMMKDYLVSGFTFSYKELRHGRLNYERVSPLELKYSKSPNLIFIRDASWAVRRTYLTFADVVERYHNSLSEADVTKIQAALGRGANVPFTGQTFYDYLRYNVNETRDLCPVYHVTWRGKKQVKILSYPDPITGEPQEMEVDEAYPVDKKAGESSRTIFRDEIYEATRILENIYVEARPLEVQTGALPYNGRAFSDTHADNQSIMQIGLPFQIMVMIVNWSLERMIAKNKGKIVLFDINAIPKKGDWDEEKFFYYADALGYGLLDRNSRDVDRSWNQYQVLDMDLFEQIKQLIDLQNHYRQMWDDVLGITMPRKGQTMASASPTNAQMQMFQSNVITDNIFNSFEEVIEEDLRDMLEYSRIINADGVRDLYTSDLYDSKLMEIDPIEYCNAALGLIVKFSSQEKRKLDEMKAYMQEMLQNGVKPSTMLKIIASENVAELQMHLRIIEEQQAKMEQAAAENEQQAAEMQQERMEQFEMFKLALQKELINEEWDRKDQNTMIEGAYNIASFTKSDDPDGDGVPNSEAIADRIMKRFQVEIQESTKRAKLDQDDRQHKDKVKLEYDKMQTHLQEVRINAAAKRAAAKKKSTSKK
jgi:hypothetical protein